MSEDVRQHKETMYKDSWQHKTNLNGTDATEKNVYSSHLHFLKNAIRYITQIGMKVSCNEASFKQYKKELLNDTVINNALTITRDCITSIGFQIYSAAIEITYLPMISIVSEYMLSIRRLFSNITAVKNDQSPLCRGLRYYTGTRTEGRVARHLEFRDGASGGPPEMRSEAERRRSFASNRSLTAKAAESMASAGFFMDADSEIRCAFCRGKPRNLTDGESPMRVHSSQFGTCPFVLGLDVGNQVDTESGDESLKVSTQCSQQCGTAEESVEAAAAVPETDSDWRSLAMSDAGGERLQRRPQETAEAASLALTLAPLCLPPAVFVRAALGERAVLGLESLERVASQLPARHPSFIKFCDRLATLHNIEFDQPTDQVAAAGFFCCSASDEATSSVRRFIVCFSCDLRLPAGPSIGDIWVAHATWAPRCGHVLTFRGAAFVRRVRAWGVVDAVASVVMDARESAGGRCSGLQPLSVSSLQLIGVSSPSLGIRFRVEARDFRARADTPAALDVVTLGFQAAEVRVATELRLVATGDDFPASEQLLAAVVVQREATVRRGQDIEAYREAELQSWRSQCPSDEPPDSPETDWRTCKVCMDKLVNVVLMDCGHLCCCSRCSRSLQTCPICRQPIRAEAPVKFM